MILKLNLKLTHGTNINTVVVLILHYISYYKYT